MFYLVMLLIFITAVVLQIVAEPGLKSIGLMPLRVMHSILACHLVIHVRVVASEHETDTVATKTPIVFAQFPAESRHAVDTVI
ncbi:hypothetical protein B0H13DRAFT_2126967 [Mycena leptocephala]|nr:hypothetical protein B0H13DRAFT_2126967 [Mycena leptocephala]